ncbi:MAG: RNA methyltransferase [Acidimicrobiia bacterium]|nr:RNA methyltransferase [Acidimicrobiia bacterium]
MIASPQNKRIKHLTTLRKRRIRDAEVVTLVEGLTEFQRASQAGAVVREVYFDPTVVDEARFAAAAATFAVSPEALAKAAMRDSTEGFVAVVEQPGTALDSLDLPPDPLVLVVEAVEKPGNLGAMLRTADAAGVDAVLVADPETDVWNPNVVRASLGCVFTVPIGVGSTSEVLAFLSSKGIRVCATTPDTDTSLYDSDLTGSVAIAIGAEHDGLSPAFLEAADLPVRIPMAGAADSLNASVSAAVALFEAVRQRRGVGA